jgi:hypothetical protein
MTTQRLQTHLGIGDISIKEGFKDIIAPQGLEGAAVRARTRRSQY